MFECDSKAQGHCICEESNIHTHPKTKPLEPENVALEKEMQF